MSVQPRRSFDRPIGTVLLLVALALTEMSLAATSSSPGMTSSDRALIASARLQLRARPARGKFLVAGRRLTDPNFTQSVVLLTEYTPDGAIGLVINRPTDLTLSMALPEMKVLEDRSDRVYLGGPVEIADMRLLVWTRTAPDESTPVVEDVHVSGSVDLLMRLVGASGDPTPFRVYAGYAGWAPTQLDLEILRGDWHVLPADVPMIFDTPSEDLWPILIDRTTQQVARGRDPYGDAALPERLTR